MVIVIETTSIKFGERLAKLRKDGGYTRASFSEKIGMSQNTLRNYELDVREPGHTFLIQMAHEFGVSIDYLLGLTDNLVPGILQDGTPTTVTGAGLSKDALRVAHAYDSASNGIRASVEKLLDIDKIDDPIEAELASYRIELEAEQEATRLSASDTCGTNSETRKMA